MFLLAVLYAIAIFLSGFLLFLVEPMAGKRLLPLLGGSAAVWTTCLVFFQCALLLGYLYAHYLAKKMRAAAQRVVHVMLLVAAAVFFALASRADLHANTTHPISSVFYLLSAMIGVPFVALSATSPLLQAWYSETFAADGTRALPYHLFALSNLGSLLALIAYPFLIEPHLSLRAQNTIWAVALASLVFVCVWISLKAREMAQSAISLGVESAIDVPTAIPETLSQSNSSDVPSAMNRLLWLLLAGCGSLLLCAVTGYLSQNIAAIPLLWILPLIMYLLSFVLVFKQKSFYPRLYLIWLLAVGLAWVGYFLTDIDANPNIKWAVPLFCALLLIACLFCHGELHRLRPAAQHLTSFYFHIAAGGALGALFVGVVAPMVFSANYEFVYGLALITALAVIVTWRVPSGNMNVRRPHVIAWVIGGAAGLVLAAIGTHLYVSGHPKFAYGLALGVLVAVGAMWRLPSADRYAPTPEIPWLNIGCIAGIALFVGIRAPHIFPMYQHLVRGLVLVAALAAFVVWWRGIALRIFWLAGTVAMLVVVFIRLHGYSKDTIAQVRTFYGVLRVTETVNVDWPMHTLYNGTIEHGNQVFTDEMRKLPTTYYASDSGVGLAMRFCCGNRPRRIGIIGLGTGTIAAYGQPGDVFRFYDINPAVERIARAKFSYLQESKANVQVILGDARLSLTLEPSQQFDVLAIDAFSGDAIPVHLITEQAMTLYQRHMRPGGILAFHISNRYLDLGPVLQQQADRAGLGIVDIASGDDDEQDEYEAEWVLLTADQSFLTRPEVNKDAVEIKMPKHGLRLWTDDYNSLLPLIK